MRTRGTLIGNMLVLATNAHAKQFDKGGNPYILHPLRVMHYLNTTDEELQCIALGHDLLEDTDVTEDILREHGMTERMIYGIIGLTKMPGQSYEQYKARIFASRDTMLVKSCDLRDNSDLRRLRGVTEKDLQRIIKYTIFYKEIQERL